MLDAIDALRKSGLGRIANVGPARVDEHLMPARRKLAAELFDNAFGPADTGGNSAHAYHRNTHRRIASS